MYLCCLLPLRDILSYCYGAIWPICAESAVKPQTNKQTNGPWSAKFCHFSRNLHFFWVYFFTFVFVLGLFRLFLLCFIIDFYLEIVLI